MYEIKNYSLYGLSVFLLACFLALAQVTVPCAWATDAPSSGKTSTSVSTPSQSTSSGKLMTLSTRSSVPASVARAYARLANADFDLVERFCKQNIKAKRDLVNSLELLTLARIYKEESAFDAGVSAYRAAPNDAHIVATTAMSAFYALKLTDAIRYADEALLLDRNEPRARAIVALTTEIQRGASSLESSEIFSSESSNLEDELSRLMADAPCNFDVLLLAGSRVSLGRSRIAPKAYAQMISCFPGQALAFFRRGIYKARTDDHRAALIDFAKVLALNPACEYAHKWSAMSLQRLANWKTAIDEWSKFLLVVQNDAWAYEARAECFKELGMMELALKDYDKALLVRVPESNKPSFNWQVLWTHVSATERGDILRCCRSHAEQLMLAGKRTQALAEIDKFCRAFRDEPDFVRLKHAMEAEGSKMNAAGKRSSH